MDKSTQLQLIHAFGSNLQEGLRDSLQIIDDDFRYLLYPVGRYFAIKNMSDIEVKFIAFPENIKTITAMRLSYDQKMLAVAFISNTDEYPHLTIFYLNKQKKGEKERIFRHTDTKSSNFIAITFSHDSRFLCAVSNQPDYQLILIELTKMKVVGSLNLNQPVTRIQINPKQSHIIAVAGENIYKTYKVKESTVFIQPETLKLSQMQNFTDIAWFDQNQIIICNDKGEIYIVVKNDLKQYIENGLNQKDLGIICIQTFNKGFLVCSQNGIFGLWTIDTQSLQNQGFQFQRKWHGDKLHSVVDFVISPKQETVGISMATNDIILFELQSILLNQEQQNVNNDQNFEKSVNYEYLYNGFHNGPITDIDICLQRPLIVTICQKDCSVRIWNYVNFKCDLARKFQTSKFSQQALLQCVAFHPSGYIISLGFGDKIRVFHLMHKDLRIFKEASVKDCVYLRYSNGGQFLACATLRQGSKAYDIMIFNAYSFELITKLKGHQGLITNFVFSDRDIYLYSCGQDGCIIQWETINWTRLDYTKKGPSFQSMVISNIADNKNKKNLQLIGNKNSNTYYLEQQINNDIIPSEIEQDKNSQREFELNSKNDTPIREINIGKNNITCISNISYDDFDMGIVLGNDQGTIQVYGQGIIKNELNQKIQIHNGSCSHLRLSADGKYLFSIGEDATIFIFKINKFKNSYFKNEQIVQNEDEFKEFERENVVEDSLADLMLVYKEDIQIYIEEQTKLKIQMEDFENQMQIKIQDDRRLRDIERQEQNSLLNIEINRWQRRYNDLEQEKKRYQQNTETLIKQIEQNQKESVLTMEKGYERKLQLENEKYLALEASILETQFKNEELFKEIEIQNGSNIEDLAQDFKYKFKQANLVFESTKKTGDDLRQIYEERLEQQNEEHNYELKDAERNQDKQIQKLLNTYNYLKQENQAIKYQNKQSNDEKDKIIKNENDKNQKIEMLIQKQKEQEQRINFLNQELIDHGEILKKKNNKIDEQKYLINDLQKSKHVLNYRTSEMRKTLEPKEQQVAKLKDELFKLESEYETIIKQNRTQNEKIQQIGTLMENQDLQIKKNEEIIKQKKTHQQRIVMDIYNCIKKKDIKEWNEEMINLYKRYVIQDDLLTQKFDPKGVDEMARQINHLEKSIHNISTSNSKKIFRREDDIRKKATENASLIYDLNEISQKNLQCHKTLDLKLLQYDQQAMEIQRLTKEIQKYKHLQSDSSQHLSRLQSAQNNTQIQKLPIQQCRGIQSANRNRGQSAKQTSFDNKNLQKVERARVQDLIVENQKTELNLMKQQVMVHKQQKGCQIEGLEYQDSVYVDEEQEDEQI